MFINIYFTSISITKMDKFFQCKENHGMFVRQSQLTLLDDSGVPIAELASPSSGASAATTPDDSGRMRSRLSRYFCPPLVLTIVIFW